MPLNRQQKRDALELIVFSVLKEGPLYGYAMIKRVAGQSEGLLRLTPGVLYPLLHELEKQKLITSRWEAVKSDRHANGTEVQGRKRKWYRIIAKGERRLEQRIRAHRTHQTMIESFLPVPPPAEGGTA